MLSIFVCGGGSELEVITNSLCLPLAIPVNTADGMRRFCNRLARSCQMIQPKAEHGSKEVLADDNICVHMPFFSNSGDVIRLSSLIEMGVGTGMTVNVYALGHLCKDEMERKMAGFWLPSWPEVRYLEARKMAA